MSDEIKTPIEMLRGYAEAMAEHEVGELKVDVMHAEKTLAQGRQRLEAAQDDLEHYEAKLAEKKAMLKVAEGREHEWRKLAERL